MAELGGTQSLEAGIITLDVLKEAGRIPPPEVLERVAVPIIDCLEDIPCTPCRDVCPTGAITMKTMINRPEINWDACTGCTLCAQACPGLAINIVNYNFGRKSLKRPGYEEYSLVMVPYELTPLPKKGELVEVFDRAGRPLGSAEVFSVTKSPKFGTVMVSVLVPQSIALNVKHVEVRRK
ncbi:MAG: 4Fe-4S binding protein [Conexivisphaera sp.]